MYPANIYSGSHIEKSLWPRSGSYQTRSKTRNRSFIFWWAGSGRDCCCQKLSTLICPFVGVLLSMLANIKDAWKCVCASYILHRLRWAHFLFVKEILERVLLLHASLEKTYEAQGQNSHIFNHSCDIFQHMSMNSHIILHFKVLNGQRRTWSQRK